MSEGCFNDKHTATTRRTVQVMRAFPSVCKAVEAFPIDSNCNRPQTNPTHGPDTPDNLMVGESEGGKGYHSGGQDKEWAGCPKCKDSFHSSIKAQKFLAFRVTALLH